MLAFQCSTASLARPSRRSHTSRRRSRHSTRSHPCPEDMKSLSIALRSWHNRTQSPSNRLPSDSDLRRCPIARELSLRTLISRAGGHRTVQSIFNLSPPPTSRERFQHRELLEMATALRTMCMSHALPPPDQAFPHQRVIREYSPFLANRIAAFPGRHGYRRLAEHIQAPMKRKPKTTRDWGVWTEQVILTELSGYQSHPRVLPRLCALPASISAAIQRCGGATVFAAQHSMAHERDLDNVRRFARLVHWLAQQVDFDATDSYVEGVKRQAERAPAFPSTEAIAEACMTLDLSRYGGRRSMATRLGFARESGIRGLFMGPFSVRLAADVLQYATHEVLVHPDGSIGMPSVTRLCSNGRADLADAIRHFGGEVEVGRRIGLVPKENSIGKPMSIP